MSAIMAQRGASSPAVDPVTGACDSEPLSVPESQATRTTDRSAPAASVLHTVNCGEGD